MKTLIALIGLVVLASGCVAVPVEPAPVVYAAPPPPVIVRPAYPRYYYRPYWRRGWY
jgi:hypothetical protein